MASDDHLYRLDQLCSLEVSNLVKVDKGPVPLLTGHRRSSSPLVGCSIGLVYKKQPVVGVINMPFLNQIVRLSPF
jgi:hypothetical protein